MSLIISRVDYPVTIDVVGPDGATDSVNLQGHGRITLPEGYVLDPRMATFYPMATFSPALRAHATVAPSAVTSTI